MKMIDCWGLSCRELGLSDLENNQEIGHQYQALFQTTGVVGNIGMFTSP